MACGDALGAGYGFGPPLGPDVPVTMSGGGPFEWEPGEWTDDTSMAIAIAEVAADGHDLLNPQAQNRVAARWSGWAQGANDVGSQTLAVLDAARQAAARRGQESPSATDLTHAAQAQHARAGHCGGNGSLLHTAPIALAFLDDPAGLVRVAHQFSALTQHDPEAGEASALWCLAIRHAVLHGNLQGLRLALDHLPDDRALVWSQRLDHAEASIPADFERHGCVVQPLQGAWSAIATSRDAAGSDFTSAEHARSGLEAAVRGSRDTDTVAAAAGALLGSVYGASAMSAVWRRRLHGWPGLRSRDLVRLSVMITRGGRPDVEGWPASARMDYSS